MAQNTARFVDAHVDDVAAAHQQEFAIEDESAAPRPIDLEQAYAYEPDAPVAPMFALPALGQSTRAYNSQGRPSAAIHYVAVRALSAYLAQRTFASASGDEPRLIDLVV